DNAIYEDVLMVASTTAKGLYSYTFQASSDLFAAGKAFKYVMSESLSNGRVMGSGMVEAMSITTIAGLASAAPEAERAAKAAVAAITALQAMVANRDNTNIGTTLRKIQTSVDRLPEVFAQGKMEAKLASETLNEISNRLKKLTGNEGYDLKELIEQNLNESPSLKEIRTRTDTINSVVDLLLKLFEAEFGGEEDIVVSVGVESGSVRFRIFAANPSKSKTQRVDIKNYLPQEVRPKDVINLAGLDLDYDAEKGIYYVYRPGVELYPSEIRIFEIEVEDVWIIPENKLKDLRTRTKSIMERIAKTEYYLKAKEVSESIYSRLDTIATSQADDTISRERHIGIYRDNLEVVGEVKEDIAKLEKLLATAGGPLAPEMLTKTRLKSESPTKTMTWIIIFAIILFVTLLAAVLFFTWHHQTRVTREELLSAKKSAFPDGSNENTS
ncbi:MAG: hypothetical protein KKC84_02065, partial [Candidatus Omnitrophica bacterium]|nr:hypothetical protein [Candidatus Omnitrophota bacterium]